MGGAAPLDGSGAPQRFESLDDDLMHQASSNSVIDYDRFDQGGYAIQRDKAMAMAAKGAKYLNSAKHL